MDTLNDIRDAYCRAIVKFAEGVAEDAYSVADFLAFLKAEEDLKTALEGIDNANS